MKRVLVSIIIVNHNGRDLLKKALDSIYKTENAGKYEMIVVDNNSTDDSIDFIKRNYKAVRIIKNDINLGYVGINSALPYCKGNYILFLNNDMEIDKNCIGNMVKAIESDKNIEMVAPKLINYYDKNLVSQGTWVSRAFYNGHIKGNAKSSVKEIPYLGVGLIKKDFVDMFGYLFDPDYFIYAEDLDLGLRIRLNGKKTIFDPDAIIYHIHARTTEKISKSFPTYLMERNSLITFFKILSLKNIIFYLPYVFGIRLFAVIMDMLTLNFNNTLARIKAILWIIFHINLIIKKRKETQKFRKADDKFILKVFSEKYLFKKKFIV